MATTKLNLRERDLVDAVITVTYMCNSRCIQCNIWQYKGPQPLDSKEYLKVPASLRTINISGGEVFLRPDLADVVENIKRAAPNAKFKISTNGFTVELGRKRLQEIIERIGVKDLAIVVSIDGDEQKQFEVRRIPEGYQKNMEFIKMVRELGINDVTIAFTAGDYNIDQLMKMYQTSKDLGTEFTCAVLHNSDHYFQITTNHIDKLAKFRDEFMKLIRAELSTWNPKRWVRAFFEYGIIFFLLRKERLLPNYAGRKAFFLDPNGFVYASDASGKPMGNIKDHDSFQQLLDTEDAQKVVAKEADNKHWMICTVRTAIQSHPFKVIYWILKSKFIPSTLKAPEVE